MQIIPALYTNDQFKDISSDKGKSLYNPKHLGTKKGSKYHFSLFPLFWRFLKNINLFFWKTITKFYSKHSFS